MRKVFISMPMNGRTEADLRFSMADKRRWLKDLHGLEAVDTVFDFDEGYLTRSGVANIPVYYIARSLEKMSLCDTAYFCKGWEDARGCRLEHEVAKAYGLNIMYEK